MAVEKKHAKLGPSAAHRWLNCPASVAFCAGVITPETPYMAEGTAAHDLAERCLASCLTDAAGYLGARMSNGVEVTQNMVDAVNVYLKTIDAIGAGKVAIEQYFSLTYIDPDLGGTCDALCARSGTLHVLDYKHGAGSFVDVDHNPQLLLYALGALSHPYARGCHTVEITVVQPRCRGDAVRSMSIGALELIEWGETVARPGAAATRDPNAPFVAGEHCKFCPRKGDCPTFEARALEGAKGDFEVLGPIENPMELKAPVDFKARAHAMSTQDLARRQSLAKAAKVWADVVLAEGKRRAMAGEDVPGWKLIESPARRVWADRELTSLALYLNADVGDLLAQATPAAIERLSGMGKAEFADLAAAYIERKPSAPQLVPVSHPKPALTAEKFLDLQALGVDEDATE